MDTRWAVAVCTITSSTSSSPFVRGDTPVCPSARRNIRRGRSATLCLRRRVALLPPRRLSAVMFPRSYVSARSADIRLGGGPPLPLPDTCRWRHIPHGRPRWAPIAAAVPGRRSWRWATLTPPIAVTSPPGRPRGALISVAIPRLRLRQRASTPASCRTSAATHPARPSARGADLRGRLAAVFVVADLRSPSPPIVRGEW